MPSLKPFAWHGLLCLLPEDWSPLKLEGDGRRGLALFADLQRTRLELRWQRLRRPPADVEAMLRQAVAQAAGTAAVSRARVFPLVPAAPPSALTARQAAPASPDVAVTPGVATSTTTPASSDAPTTRATTASPDTPASPETAAAAADGTPDDVSPTAADPKEGVTAVYLEDEPPYRCDYAAVYFPASRRLLELHYPLRRPERTLEERILPTVAEVPDAGPTPWAVFELTCLTPAGYRLERHRLNAGDLALFFVTGTRFRRRGWLSVRQIAVASLALQRTRLFGWLRAMQKPDDRLYRAAGDAEETEVEVAGQQHRGLRLPMRRRRRYGWMRWLPPACITIGCHDTARDRLVIVHGTSELEVRQLAATVGLGLIRPRSPDT
ncbi:MAG: hypothetical protein ACK4PI_03095 [Tepidisphaerales bacterium]